MCNSIANQIKALGGLVVQDASVLSSAIAASGFSAAHKAELANAVAAGASQAVVPEFKARKACQTWTAVETYLTKDDWDTLQSTASRATKVAVLVDRLHKVGLTCPNEATVKHMVALVAAVHCPDAKANDLHDMVLQVKTTLKGQQGHAVVLQHLKTFPAAPADLPSAHYQNAYSDSTPCNCSIPRFQEVLSKVPLRTSNKAIVGASGSAGACSVASQQDKPSAMEFMSMFWQQLQAHQHQSQAPLVRFTDQSQLSARAAALVNSPAESGAAPLAIMDGNSTSPHNGGRPAPSADDELGQLDPAAAAAVKTKLPPSLEGDEDMVSKLEQLAGGFDAAGKPAAALVKSKSKAKGKAASKPCVMAKPAAAVIVATKLKTEVTTKNLQLGCTKCRGSSVGCVQCRNPSYGGKRFTRK